MSPDRRWLVLGLYGHHPNATVWDTQTHQKVHDIHGHSHLDSVDISADSTKFATASADYTASIWSMTTGKRLVGPLQHECYVMAVRFSPTGDRMATATGGGNYHIRIFDSENGHQLLSIPCRFISETALPLAWSADGRQLFAASYNEVKRFDTSSGSLLSKWSVPGGPRSSIILSRNLKFATIIAHESLSFWDTVTEKQIGTVINHASDLRSIALSPKDDCIAVGESNGKITLRSLRDILPHSYVIQNQLPFMDIDDAALKYWTQGDLTRTEALLTEVITDPNLHAHALAQRALVRSHLKQTDMAMVDAKKSIEAQRSVIGYIADAVTRLRNGDHESAIRVVDLVFTQGLAIHDNNNLLLLIKAIILFECGKHHDAISRVDDLINIVDDKSLYIVVRAQLSFLLEGILVDDREMELLVRARDAIPFQSCPHLVVISLIFGWDFDKLDVAIALWLQKSIKPFEDRGDAAMQSKNTDEAILQYSSALSLNLSNPAGLLVKRSKARAMMESWEEALKDADNAINADPGSPWGYERRHAALHGLQRYDDAVDAFTRMLSLIEGSDDQDIRQLGTSYISPSQLEESIDSVIRGVSKTSPLVLVDVKSGLLCDGQKRSDTFKSEPEFNELRSSLTEGLDDELIRRVVIKYFRYVALSHVWQGKEPSFQDVNLAGSVSQLDSSPLNKKLRRFCEVVSTEGYRWAWSDTCCIDKTISTVLNQSLTMMYKWYEAAASTFIYLEDVDALSALGNLKGSRWMTRAWTAQELLATKVIRFYDRNWEPYLGDTSLNHKESPEIMQELADKIEVASKIITAFHPDDLSIREKLRLASTRNATVEEDVAYSLIGIFKSDIRPHYGEGDSALGHLLEEIVARSGEVTVLAWTGKSSAYNSCLPATLAVYSRPPGSSPATNDAEVDTRVAVLRNSLPQTDATSIYDRVIRLPPARFANRRLHLPCIIFTVKKLGIQNSGGGREFRYRVRVSGIGDVDFQTADHLAPTEPRKLIFVHPWVRDLYDPLDGFDWENPDSEDEDEDVSDPETDAGSAPSSPLVAVPAATMDHYTRALRMISRMQQPFHVLILQKQINGEFKRVAAEHEIILPGIDCRINLAKDVRTAVVEIL
ncbi:WD40 repeat-like protein [Imleria badia]|nr:WD40 repeat-like protein [Imleria badia]